MIPPWLAWKGIKTGLKAALVAAGVALVGAFAFLMKFLGDKSDELKKRVAELEQEVALLKGQLEQERQQKAEAVSKEQAVIDSLKAEIAELEKALEANNDPAAVRTRLNRLLDGGEN